MNPVTIHYSEQFQISSPYSTPSEMKLNRTDPRVFFSHVPLLKEGRKEVVPGGMKEEIYGHSVVKEVN